jgi:hypothetical protein
MMVIVLPEHTVWMPRIHPSSIKWQDPLRSALRSRGLENSINPTDQNYADRCDIEDGTLAHPLAQ